MGAKQSTVQNPINESPQQAIDKLSQRITNEILEPFCFKHLATQYKLGSAWFDYATEILGNDIYSTFSTSDLTLNEFMILEKTSVEHFINYEILHKKLKAYLMTKTLQELYKYNNRIFHRNAYREITKKLLGFITTNKPNTDITEANWNTFATVLIPPMGSLRIEYEERSQLIKTRFLRELIFQSKAFNIGPCIETAIRMIIDFNNVKFQRIEDRSIPIVSENQVKGEDVDKGEANDNSPSAPNLDTHEGSPPGGANLE